MIDGLGRKIDYIRISLTDRCNFRCIYCMPEAGVEPMPHERIMRFEELLRVCEIMGRLGINKLKLSGGEPLVRRGVDDFVAAAKRLPHIEQVTLTTNGQLLPAYLPRFREAGVDGLNISIDTLDPQLYRRITRRGELQPALDALTAAYEADFCPVKVNCVAMKGINEQELPRIAAISRDRQISVRFIEMMPIGLGRKFAGVSGDDILAALTDAFGSPRKAKGRYGNGPAHYYDFPGFAAPVGIIDAVSHRFCGSCNRVRLTADGHLKLCLNYDIGCDLLTPLREGAGDEDLAELIRGAVARKPANHLFGVTEQHTETKNMNQIGG
ncbi:MAG: GTP 3',8-cyclase MoaA [Firmicutes bacterium]|nr:GTP 3',8-cyclase MoaA [Bacillota bacterium]